MISYQLKIIDLRIEAPNVKSFIFEKPVAFNHLPGQFCWLSLPSIQESKIPMAIASGIEENFLLFTMRSWGFLTKKFFDLKIGDTITISEPLGSGIPLERFKKSKIVYGIAGGTGITPLRSLIYSIPTNKIKLFYGVKNPDDFIYKNELGHWNIDEIVEEKNGHKYFKGKIGYVTALLKLENLDTSGLCHICGPSPMMQNVVSILLNYGFPKENIYVSLEKMKDGLVLGPVLPVSDQNVEFN